MATHVARRSERVAGESLSRFKWGGRWLDKETRLSRKPVRGVSRPKATVTVAAGLAHRRHTEVISLLQARKLTKKFARDVVLGTEINSKLSVKKQNNNDKPATFSYFFKQIYLPQARLRRRSLDSEVSTIRNHVLVEIGHLSLSQITKSHIAILVNRLVEKGLAPATVNRAIAHVRAIFNRAIELDFSGVDKNPTKGVKSLPNPRVHERYLNSTEANRLIAELTNSKNKLLPFIITFMLLTGCRKREVLDAHWSNINLEQNLMKVPISKNAKPRYIVLSDEAKDILIQVRQYLQENNQNYSWDDNWVFPNPATGKPFLRIQTGWEVARRRAGLSNFRMHDLRHSFASALINSGMTLYDVKEALGHSNLVTTQRYEHLAPQRLMKAVSAAPKHYRLANSRVFSKDTAEKV